tara:strand:+ start:553 stop:855 length:303 start_codon:yes stop_codon:yes gene_type:complete
VDDTSDTGDDTTTGGGGDSPSALPAGQPSNPKYLSRRQDSLAVSKSQTRTSKESVIIRVHFPRATTVLLGIEVEMKTFQLPITAVVADLHKCIQLKFKVK